MSFVADFDVETASASASTVDSSADEGFAFAGGEVLAFADYAVLAAFVENAGLAASYYKMTPAENSYVVDTDQTPYCVGNCHLDCGLRRTSSISKSYSLKIIKEKNR